MPGTRWVVPEWPGSVTGRVRTVYRKLRPKTVTLFSHRVDSLAMIGASKLWGFSRSCLPRRVSGHGSSVSICTLCTIARAGNAPGYWLGRLGRISSEAGRETHEPDGDHVASNRLPFLQIARSAAVERKASCWQQPLRCPSAAATRFRRNAASPMGSSLVVGQIRTPCSHRLAAGQGKIQWRWFWAESGLDCSTLNFLRI
jgi:hypothetical protein